MLTISGPVPYWPPLCGARKMSPLPLSAPLASTVTRGAWVPAVAADPDEHETTAAHSAAVASAAATLNFTRTSETIRRPAENSLTPYNEPLPPPFPLSGDQLVAATSAAAAAVLTKCGTPNGSICTRSTGRPVQIREANIRQGDLLCSGLLPSSPM